MIGPNMATLLAFVLTDAAVAPADLDGIAIHAAKRSFNCISVEGHTSTNDSLIFLANGTGPYLIENDLLEFETAAIAVCTDLARAIVDDAEGASHVITIEVEGLRKYFPVHKGLLSRVVGQVKAVDGVSFTIQEGEILCLVGESGCGKSTVGRTITRLLEPSGGRIVLRGRDITRLGQAALRPHRRAPGRRAGASRRTPRACHYRRPSRGECRRRPPARRSA